MFVGLTSFCLRNVDQRINWQTVSRPTPQGTDTRIKWTKITFLSNINIWCLFWTLDLGRIGRLGWPDSGHGPQVDNHCCKPWLYCSFRRWVIFLCCRSYSNASPKFWGGGLTWWLNMVTCTVCPLKFLKRFICYRQWTSTSHLLSVVCLTSYMSAALNQGLYLYIFHLFGSDPHHSGNNLLGLNTYVLFNPTLVCPCPRLFDFVFPLVCAWLSQRRRPVQNKQQQWKISGHR